MRLVRHGTPLVSVVRSTEASTSLRFLKYYFYGSFNPFLAACPFLLGCPLLGGSVVVGSTVYHYVKEFSVHGEHVCRDLDARGGKKTTNRHTHTHTHETTRVTKIIKIIQSAEVHIIIIGQNI